MEYSIELIKMCRDYARVELNQYIPERTAGEYLDSYARLCELLTGSKPGI